LRRILRTDLLNVVALYMEAVSQSSNYSNDWNFLLWFSGIDVDFQATLRNSLCGISSWVVLFHLHSILATILLFEEIKRTIKNEKLPTMRIPIPSRRRRSANVIIMTCQVGQSSVSKLPKIKDSLVRERMDLRLLSVGIPRFSPYLNSREIMEHATNKKFRMIR